MRREVTGLNALSIMRPAVVQIWTQRDNARWVHGFMTVIVVRFNVPEINGLRHARLLIEVTQIMTKIRKVLDALAIAFEMPVIHRVEAYQGSE